MGEPFSVSALQNILIKVLSLDSNDAVSIAFSGGLDSSVLLHGLVGAREQLNFSLRALHVDHSLHDNSRQWSSYCQNVCSELGVRYESTRLQVDVNHPGGIEAAARDARYGWFESVLLPEECLAFAHHADDQLETMIFRLIRGAGAQGLQGMQVDSRRNGFRIVRPLLKYQRQQLEQWANNHDLRWLEDPANQDSRFDRVFLRQQITPLLLERWPAASIQANRTSQYAADVVAIADDVARSDIAAAAPPGPLFADSPGLSCSSLRALPMHRLNHALRVWCRTLTAPMPRGRLASLIDLVRSATGHGEIRFDEYIIRRYRDGLFVQRLNPDACASEAHFQSRTWSEQDSGFETGEFRLDWQAQRATAGRAVSRLKLQQTSDLRVRPLAADEAPELRINGHQRRFKQLCQSLEIPSWDRRHLPLLVNGADEIIAIAGVCVDDRWIATGDEIGVFFQLTRMHGLDLL